MKVAFCPKRDTTLNTDGSDVKPTQENTGTSPGTREDFLSALLSNKSQSALPFKGLAYSVYGWCVKIWKPGATGSAWPRCVWIKYNTSPAGQSLTWATDQDGRSVSSPAWAHEIVQRSVAVITASPVSRFKCFNILGVFLWIFLKSTELKLA